MAQLCTVWACVGVYLCETGDRTFAIICKLLTALSEREDLTQKSETEESLLVVLVARLLLICTDNIRVAEINIRKETKNKSNSLYPLFPIFFCTFFLHVHPPCSDCDQICKPSQISLPAPCFTPHAYSLSVQGLNTTLGDKDPPLRHGQKVLLPSRVAEPAAISTLSCCFSFVCT